MKRAIVVAISVILALVVAAPIASGQSSSQGKNLGKGQNLGKLTGDWWNWAVSTNPSPVNGGDPCGGNFVDGVFFLGGQFDLDGPPAPPPVTRTCTVPANTPILFPVANTACGAAPTIDPDEDGTFTGDPHPYSKCAQDPIDFIASNSTMIATLDEQPLDIQRLESGPVTFTVPSAGTEIAPHAPPGSYKSWASGFWVYLPQGLEPGTHTLHWEVTFEDGTVFQNVTYILTVVD